MVVAAGARADGAQLEEAIAAAKRAFPAWSSLAHAKRQDYLIRLADAMEARENDFCTLLTREQGKPLDQARFEVGGAIAALRYFAELDLPIETIRETEDGKILEQRTPLGVVGAITPWNFPVIRSEEHTSELQSLMRISYAVFCLKKKKTNNK